LKKKMREARNEIERLTAAIRCEYVTAGAQRVHDAHETLNVLREDFIAVSHEIDLPHAVYKSLRKGVEALHALASDLDFWALDLTIRPQTIDSRTWRRPRDGRRPDQRGKYVKRQPINKPGKPKSLFHFLAWKGGLRPDPELRALFDGRNPFVPRLGKRIRKAGMSLDVAREACIEEGFLQDPRARAQHQ
jgi:hypothetical protein